ncbi:MAG TPA: hypothetical protein VMB50_13120 [Myxococcales bacterium]|nr:hypothetical protein [Myxococcales bacterium]
MKAALPIALALAACSSSTTVCSLPGDQSGDDAGDSCAAADPQIVAAVDGNQSCAQDSDCVLVQAPSCDSSGLAVAGFVSIALTDEAQVEHDFSVVEAEDCPACSKSSTTVSSCVSAGFGSAGIGSAGIAGGGIGGFGSGGTPTAACNQATCSVVLTASSSSGGDTGGFNGGASGTGTGSGGDASSGGTGGSGAFEWSCGDCTSSEYCVIDFTSVEIACPGYDGYDRVEPGGECYFSQGAVPLGGSCVTDGECGQGNYCADGGACATGCPHFQPASCSDGCQLEPDGQGCNICWCQSCPDGGPADAGNPGR